MTRKKKEAAINALSTFMFGQLSRIEWLMELLTCPLIYFCFFVFFTSYGPVANNLSLSFPFLLIRASTLYIKSNDQKKQNIYIN
jgi:hypothetical protein